MTDKRKAFDFLVKKSEQILNSGADREEKLKKICKLFKDNVPYYNWVGFYLVDKERENELILGPFEGEPTEHVRIPFGSGICGQAAQRRKTYIVQDVTKETNYLSCSLHVKSEIVIPIFKRGKIVGELDIDSHALAPFSVEDETFLKQIGEMTSKII
jgi:GAF domain-containing protein